MQSEETLKQSYEISLFRNSWLREVFLMTYEATDIRFETWFLENMKEKHWPYTSHSCFNCKKEIESVHDYIKWGGTPLHLPCFKIEAVEDIKKSYDGSQDNLTIGYSMGGMSLLMKDYTERVIQVLKL